MSDRQRILVFNPAAGGSILRLRDGRTASWSAGEPIRALPPRDAADAVRFGGMAIAEPLPVVAARLGLTVDEVRAVEPSLAVFTPRDAGEPLEVVVLDTATCWRLRAAAAQRRATA